MTFVEFVLPVPQVAQVAETCGNRCKLFKDDLICYISLQYNVPKCYNKILIIVISVCVPPLMAQVTQIRQWP